MNLSLEVHTGCVNALVLYNSENYLLSDSRYTTIIIWKISKEFKLTEIIRGHKDSIKSLIIYQEFL